MYLTTLRPLPPSSPVVIADHSIYALIMAVVISAVILYHLQLTLCWYITPGTHRNEKLKLKGPRGCLCCAYTG